MAQEQIQIQTQKQQQVQRLSQQQMLQVKLLEMPLTELEESVNAELMIIQRWKQAEKRQMT